MTRQLFAVVLALASCAAFARGAMRGAADFWTQGSKSKAQAKSVLEKGYVPPADSVEKAPAGSDDANLLLSLIAEEESAKTSAKTNATTSAQGQKPVAKDEDKPAKSVRPESGAASKRIADAAEKPTAPERIVTVEKPVTNTVEVVRVEKVEVDRLVTNVVEKIVEKPIVVERPVTNTVEVVKVEKVEVEKPVTNIVEKVVTVEKPVEVVVERHVTNVVEKVVEVKKPVIVEKKVVVERTNVVEKVIYDRSVEMRLAKDKTELERRGGMLEARNAGLEKRNDELKRELEEERRQRERLERAIPSAGKKPKTQKKTGRPARITSEATYYDRKRGVAMFDGKVHVDDESYQMHADKAYVFMTGTNDVRRIVAVGHVAMTNEARRAYGGKVSYYRKDGMVVLYAGDGVKAEIRDESKAEDQVVTGSRIKFWIDNQQVEVLDAGLSAPTDGAGLQGFGK